MPAWNRVIVCFGVVLAFASAAAPSTAFAQQLDELGFSYQLVFQAGLWRRDYAMPEQRAIVREVKNHLGKIGLPDSRPLQPQQGHDAHGRHWRCDELGYPYYEQTTAHNFLIHRVYYQPRQQRAAAWARNRLKQVDWQAAVSGGVRSAAIRGFNGLRPAPAPIDLPKAVSLAIVGGLNDVAPSVDEAPIFQRLVESGVEDAVVLAMNQISVVGAADPGNPAAPPPRSPRRVDAGWAVTPRGVFPLPPGQCSELTPQGLDRWHIESGGRRIYSNTLYFTYFEDAHAAWLQSPDKSSPSTSAERILSLH